MKRKPSGFTLIELLVTVAIIGVLVGLIFMLAPGMILKGRQASSLSNQRQIGIAFQSFANENDFRLPGRVESGDKWPKLLHFYLEDVKVYADPADETSFVRTGRDPLDNGRNNTSYFMNGFNDVGAFEDPGLQVRLNQIEQPSRTILLAPNSGSRHYYMDFAEGNNEKILNKTLYGKGSTYLFADGSARFIEASDYSDDLWLVYKEER
jgi:prepilin-type N-terminal cleavage/methylation domain